MTKTKVLTKSQIGKKSKRDGAKFEKSVRVDLENKGWICDKWTNNVELPEYEYDEVQFVGRKEEIPCKEIREGKLVPSRPKFNPFTHSLIMNSGGFPDFIAFRKLGVNPLVLCEDCKEPLEGDCWCDNCNKTQYNTYSVMGYEVIGCEAKSNGYLDKEEREKCKWLLENNIFTKILIAKKGEKEIIYEDFLEKYK
jgi:hypothetical protein